MKREFPSKLSGVLSTHSYVTVLLGETFREFTVSIDDFFEQLMLPNPVIELSPDNLIVGELNFAAKLDV